jgi:hypothetical protein
MTSIQNNFKFEKIHVAIILVASLIIYLYFSCNFMNAENFLDNNIPQLVQITPDLEMSPFPSEFIGPNGKILPQYINSYGEIITNNPILFKYIGANRKILPQYIGYDNQIVLNPADYKLQKTLEIVKPVVNPVFNYVVNPVVKPVVNPVFNYVVNPVVKPKDLTIQEFYKKFYR